MTKEDVLKIKERMEDESTTKEDLLKIRGVIDDQQTEKIQKETKLEGKLTEVKEEFGCDNVEDINTVLDEKDEGIDILNEKIKKKSTILLGAFPWDI